MVLITLVCNILESCWVRLWGCCLEFLCPFSPFTKKDQIFAFFYCVNSVYVKAVSPAVQYFFDGELFCFLCFFSLSLSVLHDVHINRSSSLPQITLLLKFLKHPASNLAINSVTSWRHTLAKCSQVRLTDLRRIQETRASLGIQARNDSMKGELACNAGRWVAAVSARHQQASVWLWKKTAELDSRSLSGSVGALGESPAHISANRHRDLRQKAPHSLWHAEGSGSVLVDAFYSFTAVNKLEQRLQPMWTKL